MGGFLPGFFKSGPAQKKTAGFFLGIRRTLTRRVGWEEGKGKEMGGKEREGLCPSSQNPLKYAL